MTLSDGLEAPCGQGRWSQDWGCVHKKRRQRRGGGGSWSIRTHARTRTHTHSRGSARRTDTRASYPSYLTLSESSHAIRVISEQSGSEGGEDLLRRAEAGRQGGGEAGRRVLRRGERRASELRVTDGMDSDRLGSTRIDLSVDERWPARAASSRSGSLIRVRLGFTN